MTGIGLTWGILWAAAFVAIGQVIGILDPDSIDEGEDPILIGAIGAVIGLVSGVAFGVLRSGPSATRPAAAPRR